MTSASTPERMSRLASTSAGAKAISFAPPSLTARTAPPGGMPARQHDMADLGCAGRPAPARSSCGCMVIRLTPNGLSVSAWVAGDLGFQQRRRHRTAGDHAKAAGIGNGRDEMPLADPAHRAAQDGVFGAEEAVPRDQRRSSRRGRDPGSASQIRIPRKRNPAGAESASARLPAFAGMTTWLGDFRPCWCAPATAGPGGEASGAASQAHRGHRRYAGRAPRVRYIPRRSAR